MQISHSNILFRLYVLVQELSLEERNLFINHCTNVKGHKSKSKYVQLFKLLVELKEFDLKKILSKLRSTQSSLTNIAYYLQNMLFEGLALPLNNGRLGLSACKIAVSKGHFDYAEKTLSSEIEKAMKGEELEYLYELYRFMEVLEKEYRIKVKLNESCLKPFEFFRSYSDYQLSEQLYREFREVRGYSENEKKRFVKEIQPLIDRLSIHLERRFLRITASIKRIHYLMLRYYGLFKEASEIHGASFRLMMDNLEIFSSYQVLHSGHFYVLMLIDQEKDLYARGILEEICSMEVEEHFEPYQAEIWITNSLRLSLNLNDIRIGERTIRDFEENQDLFPSFEKGFLFHIASLIHFSNENWEQAIFYQNKSSNALKRSKKLNPWTNYIVKAIASFEMGNFGDSKRLLGKMSKASEDTGLKYPFVIRDLLLKVIGDKKEYRTNNLPYLEAKEAIENLLYSEDEKFASHYFNALAWIEAKITESELKGILLNPKMPRLMSIGKAS